MGSTVEDNYIRVSASAVPEKIAGVIAKAVYQGKPPTLRAVGAGAVNQMVKACAIARGYTASQGYDLLYRPGFENVSDREDPLKELTCIVMKVIAS